jgi:hypothetical protein
MGGCDMPVIAPLIAEVAAKPGKRLLVRFRNGVSKLYDCERILGHPAFEPLRDNAVLFRRVRADKHGYGVIWNDDLDLAESELWIGGKVVRERPEVYGKRAKRKNPPKLAPVKSGARP